MLFFGSLLGHVGVNIGQPGEGTSGGLVRVGHRIKSGLGYLRIWAQSVVKECRQADRQLQLAEYC